MKKKKVAKFQIPSIGYCPVFGKGCREFIEFDNDGFTITHENKSERMAKSQNVK